MPRVWDDIAFGPINQDLRADEVHTRVKQAMDHLGLSGFDDRVPHHLSYGEKKRLLSPASWQWTQKYFF